MDMIIIEINFGKGKKDEILVKDFLPNAPRDLAKEFVLKHRLKEGAIPKIAKHIEDTIRDFQSKQTEMRPQSPSWIELGSNSRNNISFPDATERVAPKDLPTNEIDIIDNKIDFRASPTLQAIHSPRIAGTIIEADRAKIQESISVSEDVTALLEKFSHEAMFNRVKDEWSNASVSSTGSSRLKGKGTSIGNNHTRNTTKSVLSTANVAKHSGGPIGQSTIHSTQSYGNVANDQALTDRENSYGLNEDLGALRRKANTVGDRLYMSASLIKERKRQQERLAAQDELLKREEGKAHN